MSDDPAARRYFRAFPSVPAVPPPSGDAVAKLDALRSAPPPDGGVRGAVRSAAKRLLGPWLAQQAAFNDAVCEFARSVHSQLATLTDRVNTIQREVVPGYHSAHARLGELTLELKRLAAVVPGESRIGATDLPPNDPPHVIEGLFVQTRIGPPPGRVLVVGPGGLHALDLAALGFQTVLFTPATTAPQHPGLTVVPAADCGKLPFADGEFDRVIVLGLDVGDDVARVMAPGGKVLASGTGGPTAGSLRVVEVKYARRAGHGWSLGGNPADAEVTLWVAEKP